MVIQLFSHFLDMAALPHIQTSGICWAEGEIGIYYIISDLPKELKCISFLFWYYEYDTFSQFPQIAYIFHRIIVRISLILEYPINNYQNDYRLSSYGLKPIKIKYSIAAYSQWDKF